MLSGDNCALVKFTIDNFFEYWVLDGKGSDSANI
jgi:hypothetical protein